MKIFFYFHNFHNLDVSGQCVAGNCCQGGNCRQWSSFTEWSEWTKCCPNFTRERTRTRYDLSTSERDIQRQEEKCCFVENWSAWSKCYPNTGFHFASRKLLGPYCGSSAGTEYKKEKCTVHCQLSPRLTPWSICLLRSNQICGQGTRTRQHEIQHFAKNGGSNCIDKKYEENCQVPCPSCKYTSWSKYSECLDGLQFRRREHLNPKFCPSVEDDIRNLLETKKCRVDCEYSQFSSWSKCSQECGFKGSQSRQRKILIEAKNGGVECPQRSQIETRKCNRIFCNCEYSNYSAFSDCVGGKKARVAVGNKWCKLQKKPEQLIEEANCPSNCEYGPWQCFSPCVNGRRQRCRELKTPAINGGSCAQKIYEEILCENDNKCL